MSLFSSKNSDLIEALGRSQAIIQFRPDGTILEANENFLAVMGYTLGEIQNKHHRMFVDAAYAKSSEYQSFWKELARGEFKSDEFMRVTKSGAEVWIQATYNPLLDSKGKIYRIVKIATDITEAKLKSLESQGQLAAIHRSQAVIHFDLKGNILEANDNFLKAVGYKLDEIKGKHHSIFVAPNDRETQEYKAFWRQLGAGHFMAGDFKRITKAGAEIWIHATYNPILDAAGRPFKVVKFASDITAEKRKNAEHEGLITAIGRSQAVISFTKDGIILDANENFLEVSGYNLDEIKGKHHRMFVEEKYGQSEQYAAFWQTLAEGNHLSAIYQRFNKAGQPIWLQASYNPIFDASGNIMKVTKFATDITQNMIARQAAIEAAEATLSTVGQSVHSAQHVNSSAQGISQGMEKARSAVEAMHGRSEVAEQSTEKLRLAAASMDGVVQLISKVADQINLLSLNATIEAARAGDAGRGFAVVANEVKMLANQTSQATTQIFSEIAAMQSVAGSVDEALKAIRSSISEVQDLVLSTTNATEEQCVSTDEISVRLQSASASVASVCESLDKWVIGMENRRRDERKRVHRDCLIGGIDGKKIRGSLRDISESGARIYVADPSSIPDQVVVELEDRSTKRGTVVRRNGRELGIEFRSAAAFAA
ncbi:methyl-accepting chemotaxis protein [Stappia indica]|uniref:methyl-accepting chemotaxis protein n=1 Tax=Stappia indica TaxID=538381 RepID=UPI00082FF31C|nr:PAS domain S-box protein [Stappia indica]